VGRSAILQWKSTLGGFPIAQGTPAIPAGGVIDPVSTQDFRATEFKSRNPDKVAFAIKASQHLR
jgi:hypothetical protein